MAAPGNPDVQLWTYTEMINILNLRTLRQIVQRSSGDKDYLRDILERLVETDPAVGALVVEECNRHLQNSAQTSGEDREDVLAREHEVSQRLSNLQGRQRDLFDFDWEYWIAQDIKKFGNPRTEDVFANFGVLLDTIEHTASGLATYQTKELALVTLCLICGDIIKSRSAVAKAIRECEGWQFEIYYALVAIQDGMSEEHYQRLQTRTDITGNQGLLWRSIHQAIVQIEVFPDKHWTDNSQLASALRAVKRATE